MMQQFGFLEVAMRQKDLMIEIEDYLKEHLKAAVKLMLKTWIKDAKIKDVNVYFAVNDIKKEIEPWDINIKVSSKGYMLGYHLLDTIKINPLYRLLSTVGDNMMKMQIVRIDFIE